MSVLRNKKAIIFFLLPALLVYSIIVMVPIAQSIYYSLFQWSGIGKPAFIGLDNFEKLVSDRVFFIALKNNILYILIVVSMQVLVGFTAALILTYVRKARSFIQTIYYIPSVITVIAIAQLFRAFYSVEPLGLFNIFRQWVGLSPIAFLSDFKTVLASVAAVEGWQYIGIYMLIFYSALTSISEDIVEAAHIDGANERQQLLWIKIPCISNIIGLSLILSLVGALRGFAAPLFLTNGGPNNRSEILATFMYKKAFSSRMLGYGSAIAVVIIIISLVGVLLINRYTNQEE